MVVQIYGANFGPNVSVSGPSVEFSANGFTVSSLSAQLPGGDPNPDFLAMNHTYMRFLAPTGQGDTLGVAVLVGTQRSVPIYGVGGFNAGALQDEKFGFEPPQLTLVMPSQGPTDGCDVYESESEWRRRVSAASKSAGSTVSIARECQVRKYVTLGGTSFGNAGSDLKVYLSSRSSPGSKELVYDALSPCPNEGSCVHEHRRLRFPSPLAPRDFSENLTLFVEVAGVRSINNLSWSFQAPDVERASLYPYDARGAVASDSVDADGNLCKTSDGAFVSPTRVGCQLEITGRNFGQQAPTFLSIMIGNKECLQPEWQAVHPRDGKPYLRCRPQEDVVGLKDARIAISSRVQYLPADSATFRSVCREGSAGLVNPTSTQDSSYFGRPGELCAPCPNGAQCYVPRGSGADFIYTDPIARPEFFRLTINVTEKLDEAKKRCPARRWDVPRLQSDFPGLQEKDFCFNFVGCTPKDACLGNNTCAKGYEYIYHKCEAWYEREGAGARLCQSDGDCRTKSGRASWRRGEVCSQVNPQDCATCDMAATASVGNVTYGTCRCSLPERCALCTKAAPGRTYPDDPSSEVKGYQKQDGECVPCPEDPMVIFVLFFLGVIMLCVGGYVLSNSDFNLAFISIGVDYFQVLAVFRSAKVKWPSFVKTLFNLFTIFNFDLDVASPECLIPDFTYEFKWVSSVLLPVGATGLLLLMFGLSTLLKKCTPRRYHFGTTLNGLISTLLIMLYYVYLLITRRALEIFNCNPVVPDDGHLYTEFTDLDCEATICRCWENDSLTGKGQGMQQKLIPGALVILICFTAGFPLLLFFLIRKNKFQIKVDQTMRAMELAPVPSMRQVFRVRERYHKIYYYFKPGKVYWIVWIVLRKAGVAICALMFRENPSFQFSFTVLILFLSYVQAVKNRPYMSTVERRSEVALHLAKVKSEDSKHVLIESMISRVRESQEHSERASRSRRSSGITWRAAHDSALSKSSRSSELVDKNSIRVYFFDYNTVERELLMAAILVCLAGVMYESGRFENRPDLQWQSDMLAICVGLVLFLSITYYMVVFAAEYMGTVPKWVVRCCADKKLKAHMEQAEQDDGEIDLVNNPMNDARLMAVEMAALQNELQVNKEMVGQMGKQLREAKKSNITGRRRQVGAPRSRPKAKKGFAPTAIRRQSADEKAPELESKV